MVHSHAEVAECAISTSLTENGGGLEVWQQCVPSHGWVDGYLASKIPVIFLPTGSPMTQCLPDEEAAVGQHVPCRLISGASSHICQETKHPRDKRWDLTDTWAGVVRNGGNVVSTLDCFKLVVQGNVVA